MSAVDPSYLSAKGEDTLLFAHVQPRAAKNGFCGLFGQRLKMRISSPPLEGEANRECIAFLAASLGISKSQIKLLKGGQSRDKTFVISRPMAFVKQKLNRVESGS